MPSPRYGDLPGKGQGTDPTDPAPKSLDSHSQPLAMAGLNSWRGAACGRPIPWGKDKCPGVPQVAGETPKISHQHLQPDGALPPPSGGQQGEESHACRGERAGYGGAGRHKPGAGCSQGSEPLRPLKPSAPSAHSLILPFCL